MKEIYIVIVFCVLCCLLPSLGLGIYIKWFDDDDDNGSGNASDAGSCTTPTTAGYDYDNVSGSNTIDSFSIDINCSDGYNGSAVTNVCSASGEPYSVTGCSLNEPDCSSGFPNPTDLTYNLIDGVDITNYDITNYDLRSIGLNDDINCSGVGNITCNSDIGASGVISCSGTTNTPGTISCSGTSGSGVFYLSGCADVDLACTDGQYMTDGGCLPCGKTLTSIETCLTCTGATNATDSLCTSATCATDYQAYEQGRGCSTCTDGQYMTDGVCLPCEKTHASIESCRRCTGATNATDSLCTSATCVTGYQAYVQGQGCSACPDGNCNNPSPCIPSTDETINCIRKSDTELNPDRVSIISEPGWEPCVPQEGYHFGTHRSSLRIDTSNWCNSWDSSYHTTTDDDNSLDFYAECCKAS